MRYSDLIENVNRRNLLKGASALIAASTIPVTPKLVDIATNIDNNSIKALKSMLQIATPKQLNDINHEILDGGGVGFFTDDEVNRLVKHFNLSDIHDIHRVVYDIIDDESNTIDDEGELYKSIFNEDPLFVRVFNILNKFGIEDAENFFSEDAVVEFIETIANIDNISSNPLPIESIEKLKPSIKSKLSFITTMLQGLGIKPAKIKTNIGPEIELNKIKIGLNDPNNQPKSIEKDNNLELIDLKDKIKVNR